jgi:hypothetical protein
VSTALGLPGSVMLLRSKSKLSDSGELTASGFSDSKKVTRTRDGGRDPPVEPLEDELKTNHTLVTSQLMSPTAEYLLILILNRNPEW